MIDALRNQFKLKELLQQLQLNKTSYFYQEQVLEQPDKYLEEHELIVTIFNSNFCAYISPRFRQVLKNMRENISEKKLFEGNV